MFFSADALLDSFSLVEYGRKEGTLSHPTLGRSSGSVDGKEVSLTWLYHQTHLLQIGAKFSESFFQAHSKLSEIILLPCKSQEKIMNIPMKKK